MGLGGYDAKTNTLTMARVKATAARALLDTGIEPLEEQSQQKADDKKTKEIAKRNKDLNQMTFKHCAEKLY